jgi:hypothetical protein
MESGFTRGVTFGLIANVVLLAVAVSRLDAAARREHKNVWAQLDYYKQTIFVKAVSTGTNAPTTGSTPFSASEIFILDSGASRSTITTSTAHFLGLTCDHWTVDLRLTGPRPTKMCSLASLAVLGLTASNLAVIVDDSNDYQEIYGRDVAGILGMDFLQGHLLLVDFPKGRIGLLPDGHNMRSPHNSVRIEMKPSGNLWLLPVGLPTGETASLLFDTGADSAVVAILYKPLIGTLGLQPPYHSSHLKDTIGSMPVQYGQVSFLTIGNRKIGPAKVGLTDTSSASQPVVGHAGLLGLYTFDKGKLVADFEKGLLFFKGSYR